MSAACERRIPLGNVPTDIDNRPSTTSTTTTTTTTKGAVARMKTTATIALPHPPPSLTRVRPAADLLPEFAAGATTTNNSVRRHCSGAVVVGAEAAAYGGGRGGTTTTTISNATATTPSKFGIAADVVAANDGTGDNVAIVATTTTMRDRATTTTTTTTRGCDEARINVERSEDDVRRTGAEYVEREISRNAGGEMVELTRELERTREALIIARKDAREGTSVVRRLDAALRAARRENDECRTRMDETIIELDRARSDIERLTEATRLAESEKSSMHVETTTAMWELKTLREEVRTLRESSAMYDASGEYDAHRELSSLREEVLGLRETSNRMQELEDSNEELKGTLKFVQHHTKKKLREMKDAVADSQEREDRMKREYEKLGMDHCRQTNVIDGMKIAYDELSTRMNEVEAEFANRTIAYEEEIRMQRMRHTSDALQRAEASISSLQRELSHLRAKASRSDKLQRDLAFAYRTNLGLAKTLSDYRTSSLGGEISNATSPPPDDGEMQERRKIEDDALKEYCTLFRERVEVFLDA
jgi:hypothetical protein